MAQDGLGKADTRGRDTPARAAEPETVAAPPDDTPATEEPIHKRRSVRFTVKLVLTVAVVYFLVLPLIPGFRKALHELSRVQPGLLAVGVVLEVASWACYSMLTRSALGEAGRGISRLRMFRIQTATKALTNVVPGGSAAGSALGYRLLTLSGVRGPDAGFALATAGLGSAVVLNVIFWIALLVSIPRRGVNPLYATAALAGVLIMLLVAGLIFGLVHGQGRAEKIVRWVAVKIRVDPDAAARVLREIGVRVEELIENKALLRQVIAWSAGQWLFDAAALWVFIRAFGQSLDVDGLFVAFGLANVLAVIPITPGGLGIVEGVYIPTLVGFDLRRSVATLGVASYRMAQYFFPILLGGLMYLSLRVGPWKIERRDELQRLRDIAADEDETRETRIDFARRAEREAHRAHDAAAVEGAAFTVPHPAPPGVSSEGSWTGAGERAPVDHVDDEDTDDADDFPHNPT